MEPIIKKDTLQFLKELKDNNDRDWFNTNKDRYVAANENFIQFVQSVINQVSQFDETVRALEAKKCVFRIYRDTRFAKDKSPYKTNFGAALMLGKEKGYGMAGYYMHLEPGNSFLAGGVYTTEPANLKAIRQEISANPNEFLKIINAKDFKDNFEIKGDKLAKVPQGFEKDDPMAEYLKFKALTLYRTVADEIVLADDYIAYCTNVFKMMVPFNAFMNEAMKG